MGFKIGYCEGCNEPLLVPIGDIQEMINRFNPVYILEPKKPFRQKLGEWLIKDKV